MKWLVIPIALLITTAALAQAREPNEPGYTVPGAATPTRPKLSEPGRSYHGEVRDIDKVSGTITLRHGPIGALGVPEGVKDYPVKDPSMLKDLKVGDAVRFGVVLQGRSLLITTIGPAN